MNIENLEFTPGQKNIPGLKTIGYFVPKSHIDHFPVIVDAPATKEEEFTLPDTPGFTLLAGKKWYEIYSTQGKAKVESEPQGELDNESCKIKAEMFHPGTKAEAIAFAKQAMRDDFVYIFPDHHGNKIVVGNPNFRTITKPSFGSGDAVTSTRGWMISIEVDDEIPLTLYDGAITPVSGGDASGA